MSATQRRLSSSTLTTLRSVILVIGILLACVAVYYVANVSFVDLRLMLLDSTFVFVYPKSLLFGLEAESYKAILLSVLIIFLNYSATALVVMVVTIFGVKALLAPKELEKKLFPAPPYLHRNNMPANIAIYPPAKQGEKIPPVLNPVPSVYMRLNRMTPPGLTGMEPPDTYAAVETALIEVLFAHKNYPASLDGHHASTSLYEHSISVGKELKSRSNDRSFKNIAAIVGLAHDLDKLFAYKEEKGTWKKTNEFHRQYTARIFTSIEEVSKLADDEVRTITRVLRYYHSPDELPLDSSEMQRELIELLRKVDMLTTSSEQATALEPDADVRYNAEILGAFKEAVLQIDINQYRGGRHPDGWTSPSLDYVAIPEATLRQAISLHLSDEFKRETQLMTKGRDCDKNPGASLVRDELFDQGFLFDEYKEHVTSNKLFTVKAGTILFHAVYLFRRDKLEELAPGILEKWGSTKYRTRVHRVWVDES